jgi:hypothetical protein
VIQSRHDSTRATRESLPGSATPVTETLASRSGTLGKARCRRGWLLEDQFIEYCGVGILFERYV